MACNVPELFGLAPGGVSLQQETFSITDVLILSTKITF